MKVKIIVDSTADLPEHIKNRVSVVPLMIQFGQEQYVDGVTITHQIFYEKLVESDMLPTTSQPSPEAFVKAYEEARKNGEIPVVITVSSALSGTYQSAKIASQDYPEARVVDSKSVAIGAGILAELAVEWAEAGLDADLIVAQLKKERENIRLVALLDTLEYLKKGGRITKTAAFAGGVLSIKPVLAIRNGAIEILGKAHGSRQGNNLLVKEIQAAGGVDFEKPLLLGYTGLSDALLKKYIRDSAFLWAGQRETLPQTLIGSVVGTHAGPGAVAVAFFAKNNA
ncbi:MAG: DegV family protein [Clostridiales bacterium]|nr:DegV family protein [Clostridiales bacterium]